MKPFCAAALFTITIDEDAAVMSDQSTTDSSYRTGDAVASEFRKTYLSLAATPIITYLVIAANVAVFAAMVSRGVDIVNPGAMTLLSWGGNFGPMTMNGQWWRLVSCMFLHFGIVHIGLNMWVLWGLAPLVERFAGRTGFLIAYMASGIAGSITSLAWHPTGISAGASGAVFGTAGVLLGFVILRRDTIPGEVRTRMLKSMFNFLVLNTIIGMTAARVDMAAHLGGFAGGMICGLILSQPLLVPELFQRRWIKNMMCLITAIVLLPTAFFLLPEPPVDILAELQRLAIVENEVYDTFYDAQDSAAAGKIDNKQFADRVELKVLRPWDDYIRDIDHLMTLENANQETMQRLALYLQRRKECWQTLVEGLRENNAEKLQRARQLSEESDVLLGERIKANAQPQE